MTPPEKIDQLFMKFSARWGHRWNSLFQGAQYEVIRDQWRCDLAGLTDAQIRIGIGRATGRKHEWPPSSVVFRDLCLPTPEDLGVPDVHKCYESACGRRAIHPICFHAVERIGLYAFRSMPREKSWREFEKAYWELIDEMRRGVVLEYPKRIERDERPRPPADPVAAKKKARAAMQAMREKLHGAR